MQRMTGAVSALLLLAVGITTPTIAQAALRPQAHLVLHATSLKEHDGTSETIHVMGGSGAGKVLFGVLGNGCSIGAVSGVLSDTKVSTCEVIATKAAAGIYAAASSAPLRVAFSAHIPTGPEAASNLMPDRAALVTTNWATSGFAGTHPVDDSVNGRTWFLNAFYSPHDRWLYAYVRPLATVTMTWHITGSNGQILAHQAVTLQTQFGPGANNGKGDLDATFTGTGMVNGNMMGTTNVNGNVSFTFTNTNTSAPSTPSGWSMTSTAESATLGSNVSQAAAEAIESGSGYAWARMALQIGNDVFTAPNSLNGVNNQTTNEATDLVDVIVLSNP